MIFRGVMEMMMIMIAVVMMSPLTWFLCICRIRIQVIHGSVFADGIMTGPHYDMNLFIENEDVRDGNGKWKPTWSLEISPGQ